MSPRRASKSAWVSEPTKIRVHALAPRRRRVAASSEKVSPSDSRATAMTTGGIVEDMPQVSATLAHAASGGAIGAAAARSVLDRSLMRSPALAPLRRARRRTTIARMNALSLMTGMAENNAWANLRLHRACKGLSDEEYKAERVSFFPSLHKTLSHILVVDWFYVDALEGGSLGPRAWAKEEPLDTLAELAAAQRAVDLRLVRFCAALATEADLDAKVSMVRTGRTQIERAGAVLMHLFEHQIHHRGQAHAMLAGSCVKPPQLDEFFLEEDAPLRAAELGELGLRAR
jgi:uncharacterized damage-inducible protein DinB